MVAASTPYVWIIGRTQTNGPADYDAVHKVQDGYRISAVGEPVEHVVDAGYDISTEPPKTVNSMSAVDFFSYAAELLATNPPHPTDFSQLARIANLGIAAGRAFDASGFSARNAPRSTPGSPRRCRTCARRYQPWAPASTAGSRSPRPWVSTAITTSNAPWWHSSGWAPTRLKTLSIRVLIADADGSPTTGENDYVIHFDADKLPPVAAFWSVTVYDADGFQVANELDRFAVGDRDPLTYNADGSLDLYLQHANPGPQRESNWLPAPLAPFGLTMRLYAPKREVLTGGWHPPPVHKA